MRPKQKFTKCPSCGKAVEIRNKHAERYIKQTGNVPKCDVCRAFDRGRDIERQAMYNELEY